MARKKTMKAKGNDKSLAKMVVTEIVGGEGIKVEDAVKPKETVIDRSDLMPCPCCGAPAIVVKTTENGDDMYTVKCSKCDGPAKKCRSFNEDSAVWSWNMRSIEAGLGARVESCVRKADELLERKMIYVEIVSKDIVHSESARQNIVTKTNVEKLNRLAFRTLDEAKLEFAKRVAFAVEAFRSRRTEADEMTIELYIGHGNDEKLRSKKVEGNDFDMPVQHIGVVINAGTVKNSDLGFDYLKASSLIDMEMIEAAKSSKPAEPPKETVFTDDEPEEDPVGRCLAKAYECVAEEAKAFMKKCNEGRFLSKASDRERIAIRVDDMIAGMREAKEVKPADCIRLAAALTCLVAATAAGDQDMMDDIQSVIDDDTHSGDPIVRKLESLWK